MSIQFYLDLWKGYLPALKANYYIWPAVQIVNFKFMPLALQIPFVNTVGVFWYHLCLAPVDFRNMYLSLENSSVEAWFFRSSLHQLGRIWVYRYSNVMLFRSGKYFEQRNMRLLRHQSFT
jgi:hypothetical protein